MINRTRYKTYAVNLRILYVQIADGLARTTTASEYMRRFNAANSRCCYGNLEQPRQDYHLGSSHLVVTIRQMIED